MPIKHIGCICIVVIALGVILWILSKTKKPDMNQRVNNNQDQMRMQQGQMNQQQMNQPQGQMYPEPKVTLYYSMGCGHCKAFLPTWNQFSTSQADVADFKAINCGENPSMCAGISGVPFILFDDGVNQVPYKGSRDNDSLTAFLSQF
jgi:thioredoxin-like negative regulator of GroEL